MSRKSKSEPAAYSWPVFDSIAQASASSGVPEIVLKRAKRGGCQAFRSNRIYFGEFLAWQFTPREEAPDPKAAAVGVKLALEREKLRKAKADADEAEKLVVPVADARRVLTRYASTVRTKLIGLPGRNSLKLSLLKTPLEIEQVLNAEVRAILGEVFRGEWGAIECPMCKKEIRP